MIGTPEQSSTERHARSAVRQRRAGREMRGPLPQNRTVNTDAHGRPVVPATARLHDSEERAAGWYTGVGWCRDAE